MIGVGLGIAMGGQRIRPVAQILADFTKDRYRGGGGPGILDLFDFVAAGNRTYINALGHLVTAGPNEPRSGHHQWDAAKGQWMPVGLLLEPAAVARITYPTITTATWGTNGVVFPVDLSDGFLGAFPGVLVSSEGEEWHRITAPSANMTAGQVMSLTVLVKEGTSGRMQLTIRDATLDTYSTSAGAIGGPAASSNGAGDLTVVSQKDVPGGHIVIYRFTANSTGPAVFGIGPNSAVAGENITVYFMQLEDGATATSLILANGSQLARTKDGLELSPLILAKQLVKHNIENSHMVFAQDGNHLLEQPRPTLAKPIGKTALVVIVD
ncbi:MAG: hypothetical protein HRU33_07485 [Rhodobacteraceae bacterium]|nr:hypothetical protein [Paracoccaceae bacterium]